MNKIKKKEEVICLKNIIKEAEGLILIKLYSLTAGEVLNLRKKLHDQQCKLRVIKNKLLHIAVNNTEEVFLQKKLSGETGIVWSEDNLISPIKILFDYEKETKKIKVQMGTYDHQELTVEDLNSFSKMSSINEPKERILVSLKMVYQKIPAKISLIIISFLLVLKKYISKNNI